MLHLRALGALSLQRPDGADILSVLAQSKRAALLVYLALTGSGVPTRRDILLGLFWPELDEARARAALSQALHYLRRSLGSDVLSTQGKDAVGVDPRALWCDVVAFEDALRRSDPHALRGAVELYRGDLLPGFHLPDAPEFERWLETERDRLRRRAADAAFSLAEHEAGSGRLPHAVDAARRGLELSGYSEERLRWTIALLDQAGDGAGAVQLYEHAAEQLALAYEIEPSVATKQLISAVRTRANDPPRAAPPPLAATKRSRAAAAPAPGIAPERQHPVSARTPARRARWLLAGTAAAVALLGIVAGRTLVHRWQTETAQPVLTADGRLPLTRVAVLPFANFSPDATEAYLGDALTVELISRLARLRDLRVISHSSVAGYGPGSRRVADIARDLRVRTLVEGSVLSAGDTLRVHVRIVDVTTEEPVWSRAYDVRRADLLAVQRRIAEDVAVALSVEARRFVDRLHASRLSDPGAYDEYLKGRSLLGRIDAPSLLAARTHFVAAVQRDSALAVAWSGLAQAYNHLASNGLMPAPDALPAARAAAERALSLDAELSEAHAALAMVSSNYDWNAAAAEWHFRRAIELDPSHAEAYRAYANHVRNRGRFGEAVALLRQAQDLDPRSPLPLLEEGIVHYLARDHEAALALAERLLRENAESGRARLLLALVRIELNQFHEALALLEAMDPEWRRVDTRGLRGYLLAKSGRTDEARQILADFERAPPGRAVSAFHLALVHIALGEHERAITLLEAAAAERALLVTLLHVEPKLDPLRGEPRFQSLLQKLGLAGSDPPVPPHAALSRGLDTRTPVR